MPKNIFQAKKIRIVKETKEDNGITYVRYTFEKKEGKDAMGDPMWIRLLYIENEKLNNYFDVSKLGSLGVEALAEAFIAAVEGAK